MASAVEVCLKESVDTLNCDFRLDETAWEDEDIGIVVSTGQTGKLGSPAESGTDALVLVEGHADTVAGAADCDCRVDDTVLDSESAGMSEIGIVAAIGRISAEIAIFDSLRFEVADDDIFEFETGVVAAKTDGEVWLEYAHKMLKLRLIKRKWW